VHEFLSFPLPEQHSPAYASPATSSLQIVLIQFQLQNLHRTWKPGDFIRVKKDCRKKQKTRQRNVLNSKYVGLQERTYPPDVSITSWNKKIEELIYKKEFHIRKYLHGIWKGNPIEKDTWKMQMDIYLCSE
jgi:hypothetical protein